MKQIILTGNTAFSDRTLIKQMKLQTSGLLSWFNKDDRYSDFKLDQDIQAIENYYLDHGYLDFQLVPKRAEIAPGNRQGPAYQYKGRPGLSSGQDQHHG